MTPSHFYAKAKPVAGQMSPKAMKDGLVAASEEENGTKTESNPAPQSGTRKSQSVPSDFCAQVKRRIKKAKAKIGMKKTSSRSLIQTRTKTGCKDETRKAPPAKGTRGSFRMREIFHNNKLVSQILPRCKITEEVLNDSNGEVVKQRGVVLQQDVKKGDPVAWYEGEKKLRPLPMRQGNVPYHEKLDSVYREMYEQFYPNESKSFVFHAPIDAKNILDINAIDPKKFGDTIGRNINHSTRPNVKPVFVGEKQAKENFLANPDMDQKSIGLAVCFIALCDMKAGTFLRYNYNVKIP